MFFNKFACCSVPYFNFFIGDGLALGLNSLMVHSYCVTSRYDHHKISQTYIVSSNTIHQKKKRKKGINNNWFYKSNKPLMNHISYLKLSFPTMESLLVSFGTQAEINQVKQFFDFGESHFWSYRTRWNS